eukprot:7773474-Alexandrium_andersonii.AAC.1
MESTGHGPNAFSTPSDSSESYRGFRVSHHLGSRRSLAGGSDVARLSEFGEPEAGAEAAAVPDAAGEAFQPDIEELFAFAPVVAVDAPAAGVLRPAELPLVAPQPASLPAPPSGGCAASVQAGLPSRRPPPLQPAAPAAGPNLPSASAGVAADRP